jgi:hypothetical protein
MGAMQAGVNRIREVMGKVTETAHMKSFIRIETG